MKKLYLIIISIVLFILIGGVSLFYFLIQPEALLEGEKEIILKIGDAYEEKGIKATCFIFKCIHN